MFNELTIQQLCALDYGRNMVVTAGPGAGKTRILSHRYCYLLLTDDDVSVPGILTLTFTEKAAEEMKSRIYDMLIKLDAVLEEGKEEHLRKRIRRARDRFDKNNISTIHSFCAALLKENPVEAEIDPGFSIIQGMKKNELLDRCVKKAVLELYENNKDSIICLLRSFGGKTGLFRAIRGLAENSYSFGRVLETVKNLKKSRDWKEQVFSEYCREIKEDLVVPYLNGLRESGKKGSEDILKVLEEWEADPAETSLYNGIPGLFEKLRQLAGEREKSKSRLSVTMGLQTLSYIDMVESHFPDIFIKENPDTVFEKELDSFNLAVEAAAAEYRREKLKLNCLDFSDLESRSFEFLKNLEMKKSLFQFKKIQGRYKYIMVDEFQDTNRLQWEIIRMLCAADKSSKGKGLLPGKIFVVGDKRQAIYRFRGGDVTVFERVNREIIESNPSDPAPLFFEKKETSDILSCLSFDPEYHSAGFKKLPPEERSDIRRGDIYLPHNFRSDINPVSFFNRTFRQIFGNRGAGDIKSYETAPRDILCPEEKKEGIENRGSVTIYQIPKQPIIKDHVEKEASTVSEIIERIMGRHGDQASEYKKFTDIRYKLENREKAIGILFFTFRHIRIYENILREAAIPFSVHKGKGFYKSPEVMEVVQLLNYITDRRQGISLLGVLRSPVFGVTDSELFDLFYGNTETEVLRNREDPYLKKIGRQIESWRFLSTRMTISELICRIITDRHLTAVYSSHPGGEQKIMNMEKLIDTARRFQEEDNGSLDEFVKYCLDMADQDEEEGEAVITSEGQAPVSLMTIHAAKGLEFPMVILPQLERSVLVRETPGRSLRLYESLSDDPTAWNYTEGELPVWQVEIPALEYRKKYSPLGYILQNRNRLEEVAENRRVFYVGCTRAENHLLLMGQASGKEEKDIISPEPEDYRKRATLFDIINDIYGAGVYSAPGEYCPEIVETDPVPKKFKGVVYDKDMVRRDSFGIYSEDIKSLDLSAPVESAGYFQFSFSSIRIFSMCPMRFYFNFILKLRPGRYLNTEDDEEYMLPDTGEDEYEYGSGDSLHIGNLVHRYLEDHEFGSPFDAGLFKRAAAQTAGAASNRASCEKRAEELIRFTVSDGKLTDIMQSVKNFSEIPFLATVCPGVEFRGVVDRMFKNRDTGEWIILDWKSNSLEGRNADDIIKENNYDMQLAFYKWAVEKIMGERVEKQLIYFLDGGILKEVDWRGEPGEVIEGIISKIQKYEEDTEEWERDLLKAEKESQECRFCDYGQNICMKSGN